MNILYNISHLMIFTFMAMIPVINPIGLAPIFLSLTKQYSPQERQVLAKRVAIYAFFIYFVVLLAGTWIINFFGLSIPIIKIAGGLMLFSIAFNMFKSSPSVSEEEKTETLNKSGDIAFCPLTMPVTVGAGSMAVAMAVGAGIIDRGKFDFVAISQLFGAVLGIVLLVLSLYICYYFSDRIFAKLGKVGTDVVTQLSAFILLAVSIQIVWEGVKTLLLI